jgi:hypothetical protein
MPTLGKYGRLFVGISTYLSDMGMARNRLEEGVGAERANGQGEALDVLDGQILVDECEDLMLEPMFAYFGNLRLRQRARQVHALHYRAARRVLWLNI